ncbi:TPA: WbuC family cupin fold metalloprotein [Escherichia coli]
MKKAIAYMRFSSPGQMSGDSLNRQRRLIAEWLKVNSDYYLDTITYEDLGLSAFKGKHAQSGAFSEFLDAIEHGYILPGTTLLVESLDRLSREKVGEAIERLKLILNHGIDVITLCDNTVYNIDSLNEPYSLIKAILIPGTYVRPHRHPHTFELLLPLRGRFVVLNFDDRGTVTHRAILGETCTVLEMAAGTWHAVLSLDTGGIIFEVKHGGYQPVAADDYAHWAPAEGEPGTTELMAWYAQAQVGDSTFAV